LRYFIWAWILTKILIIGDDLALGLPNDLSLLINSISMLTTSAPSESFATPSNLDLDATNVTWELLTVQLIQN